jgi:hypothetical protein
MSDRPLRILACWPYSRRGWVAPLEGLAGRGHHVTYLGYRTPEHEPPSLPIPPERDRAYWRDFRSGQDVLRRLRPDRVILMGTEGAWQIAVVAAARKAGVPTALLEHGLFSDPESYIAMAPLVQGLGGPGVPARLPAVRFAARSLWRTPIEFGRALSYLVAAARTTPWEAAPKHPLAARMADAYLVASPASTRLHRTRDHVGADRIVPVGLSEFDDLLLSDLPVPIARTALLIDTPHTGGPHGLGTLSGVEKAAHLERLAADLHGIGWSLTVKLHPDSFGDAWPVDRPGLRYARNEEMRRLIGEAAVVIGFNSTLVVPALHHRPGALLTIAGFPRRLQDRAAALGAVRAPLPLERVRADDIILSAADADATAAGRAALVEEMLGPPDGRGLDRVEAALRGLQVRS